MDEQNKSRALDILTDAWEIYQRLKEDHDAEQIDDIAQMINRMVWLDKD